MIQTYYLSFAAQKDRKYFEVHCEGPCRGTKVTLESTSGNPDLYGLETEIPCSDPTSDCTCPGCSNFCESNSISQTDVCDSLNASSSIFYITVYAQTGYDDATITFQNVQSVEEVEENGGRGSSTLYILHFQRANILFIYYTNKI